MGQSDGMMDFSTRSCDGAVESVLELVRSVWRELEVVVEFDIAIGFARQYAKRTKIKPMSCALGELQRDGIYTLFCE
jgi:hypothetical protein